MYDGLKGYLEESGWQVKTVRELGCPNAKDSRVREYAKRHDMILVTQDRKSADIAEHNNIKTILVSFGDIYELVKKELRKKYPKLIPN